MEIRDQQWFGLAILLTVILHIAFIAPLSKWIDLQLIPRFNVESMVIDLTEKPVVKKNQNKQIEPVKKKSKKTVNKEKIKTQKKIVLPKKNNVFIPVETVKKRLVESQGRPQKKIVNKKKKLVVKKHEILKPLLKHSRIKPIAKQPTLSSKIKSEQDSIKQTITKPVESKNQKTKPDIKKERSVVLDKKEDSKDRTLEKTAAEEVRSPLFLKKTAPLQNPAEKEVNEQVPEFPRVVKDTLRNEQPEETEDENLQYSMNTYEWNFERFVENWAIDIRRWWRGPVDYISGNVPEGGNIWIQVTLDKSGRLLAYKVLKSKVTAEMELMVIQALIGSLKRPVLPGSFPEDKLVINWRFIYPPLRPQINLRR